MISILLPTRRRFEALVVSMNSLVRTATYPEKLEFLLWIDADDTDYLGRLLELLQSYSGTYRIMINERTPYNEGMHHWINDLCLISKGEWLFIWNDDAVMKTTGWDDEIYAHDSDSPMVLAPDNQLSHDVGKSIPLFPIISRRWYELTEHFSLHPCNDTWVERVAIANDVYFQITPFVDHDRGLSNDEVFMEHHGDGDDPEAGVWKRAETFNRCIPDLESDARAIAMDLDRDVKDTLQKLHSEMEPT